MTTNPLNASAPCVAARSVELRTGAELRAALGYQTGEAFRAAARSGRLPVKLTKIEGRRGWFARVDDIQSWQAEVYELFESTPAK